MHNLCVGDTVIVTEGELKNLQGKIMQVDGNRITIMPKHETLKVGVCVLWELVCVWQMGVCGVYHECGVGGCESM